MKTQKKETLVKRLQKRFPDIRGIKEATYWNKTFKGGIHLGNAAEGGMVGDDVAADYYGCGTFSSEFFVNPELNTFLEKSGWFAEYYDPGTLLAFPTQV